MVEKIRDSEPNRDSASAAAESVLVRLAVRLYAIRSAKGITQSELAVSSGVDQANISDIENGDANPTAKTIGRLAAGLGVYASALLDYTPVAVRFGGAVTLSDKVTWERVLQATATAKAHHRPLTRFQRFEKIRVALTSDKKVATG